MKVYLKFTKVRLPVCLPDFKKFVYRLFTKKVYLFSSVRLPMVYHGKPVKPTTLIETVKTHFQDNGPLTNVVNIYVF